MSDFKKNEEVKLLKDVNLRQAETKARKFLKGVPDFLNGYLYLNGPTVSDLFIVKGGTARKCNSVEWVLYFREYLYPIQQ
jgi:hypothetical protein